MSTKIDAMNDAFFPIAENMKAKDMTARLILAAVSLTVLLTKPSIEIMNILVVMSVYLFTTAVLRWDPIYSLAGVRRGEQALQLETSNEGTVSSAPGVYKGDRAANDTRFPDRKLRQAG